jgi:hypothetical protein
MVGSWGGTTLFPALVQSVYGSSLAAAELTRATGIAFMAMNVGALLGFGALFAVVWRWPQVPRRSLFFVYCLGAWIATVALYQFSSDKASLHGLLVLFGFFAIGGFSILALYITELFPLAVRATGQGFTWNVARIVTAAGPITAAIGLPYFGVTGVATAVASIFLVGLIAVLFAPETRVTAN